MDNKNLKHFGVMGMKWGVKSARAQAKDDRTFATNIRKQNPVLRWPLNDGHAAKLEARAERLEAKANMTEAKINNIKSAGADHKAASKKASENPLDEKAQIDELKARQALDKAKGTKPLLRIGKKKGESNEDFDARLEKEEVDFIKTTIAERKKINANSTSISNSSNPKLEKEASKRRDLAQGELAYELAGIKERAKKDPKYTKDKQDRDEAESKAYWEKDLNMTADGIKKENRPTAVLLGATALVVLGVSAIQSITLKTLQQQSINKIIEGAGSLQDHL